MIPERIIADIDFLPTEKDSYRTYRGKLIEIHFNGVLTHQGFYRGQTLNGDLVLNPCLVDESYPKIHSKERTIVYSWSNMPAFISCNQFVSIFPLDKSYIQERIKETEREFLESCESRQDYII